MVSNLVFYQLMLIALVWVFLLLCWLEPSERAASCPTTPQTLPPPRKRSTGPKPFTGLTRKPYCEACEQAIEPHREPPVGPPPRIVSTRGRRRQVDTSHQFCPDPNCRYGGWMAVYLHTADNYHRLTRPTFTGAKRPRREGDHGIPAALSPLVTPSKPAVWTHIACSQAPSRGCFPSPPRPHTPAGCGHGGTRKSRTSRKLQAWSVNPAAIAGVWGCHRLAEPLPWVGTDCGNGRRKEACGQQKL